MKKNNRIPLLIAVLIIAVAAIWYFNKKDAEYLDVTESEISFDEADEAELREKAQMYFGSLSDLPKDVISSEKIELGKRLFFDKRLSKNETISCNSCHSLTNYGVDNLPLSPGDTKEVENRESLTVFYSS